jgi:hypothetical protein
MRVLDLFHERQEEGLPQHPEFANGKLSKTCGRWDVRNC